MLRNGTPLALRAGAITLAVVNLRNAQTPASLNRKVSDIAEWGRAKNPFVRSIPWRLQDRGDGTPNDCLNVRQRLSVSPLRPSRHL